MHSILVTDANDTSAADLTLSSINPLYVERGAMANRYTPSILAQPHVHWDRSLTGAPYPCYCRTPPALTGVRSCLPGDYIAILNMLVKAGRTGAAKAFFSAMRLAEDARKGDAEAGARLPLLNIYAHPMMLDMYAGESGH
jgi:hypothetical protein